MWILRLNDMRSPKIEYMTEICRANTKEELVQFLESERVECYTIDHWVKEFRRGGPLEWYNPPAFDNPFIHVGSRQAVIDRAIATANQRYDELESSLPTLEVFRATHV